MLVSESDRINGAFKIEPAVRNIIEASIKLKCENEVRMRALLIYHSFRKNIEKENLDAYTVAAAALLLSSKVLNSLIDVNEMIVLFYNMANTNPEPLDEKGELFLSLKKCLFVMEQIILRKLEFGLSVPLAHQVAASVLPHFFRFLRPIYASGSLRHALCETVVRLLNDFYLTNACVKYQAEDMILAAINIAMDAHGCKNDLCLPNPWFQIFNPKLTESVMLEIQREMLGMYCQELVDEPRPLPEKRSASPLPEPFYYGSVSDVSMDNISSEENLDCESDATQFDDIDRDCMIVMVHMLQKLGASKVPGDQFEEPECQPLSSSDSSQSSENEDEDMEALYKMSTATLQVAAGGQDREALLQKNLADIADYLGRRRKEDELLQENTPMESSSFKREDRSPSIDLIRICPKEKPNIATLGKDGESSTLPKNSASAPILRDSSRLEDGERTPETYLEDGEIMD